MMSDNEPKLKKEERTGLFDHLSGLFDHLIGSQEVECEYVPSQYIGTGTEVIVCKDSQLKAAITRAIAAASEKWKNNCPINIITKKDTIIKGAKKVGEVLGLAIEDSLAKKGIQVYGIAKQSTSWIAEEIANYALGEVESITITIECSGDVNLTVQWS